ncbi:MAG: peptidoglycan DD-metalloendopeptidase family protein [Desulfobacterales bacterium]|nr:peptidoglycan DD-metalloendopeptidase family protein [Desulfobacterales bacterium]
MAPRADAAAPPTGETGIITARSLALHRSPSEESPVVLYLASGTRVTVLGHSPGWLKVAQMTQIGYIRNQAASIALIRTSADEMNSPESARQEIERFQAEIRRRETDLRRYAASETNALTQLDALERALHRTRREVSALQSQIGDLEQNLAATAERIQTLRERINATEGYAAHRLVALYKLSWLGKMQLLAPAGSLHDFFQRKTALERILAHDETVWNALQRARAELETLSDSLRKQKATQLALKGTYDRQLTLLAQEKTERSALLKEIRGKKRLELAAIDTLKQSAQTLEAALQSLVPTAPPLASDDAQAGKPFSALKGLIKMPVRGKIVSFFGPYKNAKFNVTNFRSGIEIRTEPGEPIRAVYAGRVLYASWFRGYGNMVIIDHGDSYYSIYGHIEELFKSKGQMAAADEVIATAGDSGALNGPGLYFEIRYHGKPLNPAEWIKSS